MSDETKNDAGVTATEADASVAPDSPSSDDAAAPPDDTSVTVDDAEAVADVDGADETESDVMIDGTGPDATPDASADVTADVTAVTSDVDPDAGPDGTSPDGDGDADPAVDTDAGVDASADADTEPEAVSGNAAGKSAGDAAVDAPGDAAARPTATANLEAIVEALIFASPDPITPKTLYKLLADEPKEDVSDAVNALKTQYLNRPGLAMVEVAGGYQIVTRPELHEWVRRLFHERSTQKLSVAALESLAVISYKQPVTALEITEIRGVNTSGVLSTLLERNLIKIVGRKNVVGRPFMYGTTKEFLIRFGLKDLGDLPRIEDMADALGFDPPAGLIERTPREDVLPLEGDPPPAEALASPSSEPMSELSSVEPPIGEPAGDPLQPRQQTVSSADAAPDPALGGTRPDAEPPPGEPREPSES